jgi:peptidoglycan/LPS O-acetylase OafA/YrhL
MAVVLAFAGKKYIYHLIIFFLVMITAGQLFPYLSSLWTFITNPVIAEFVFGCLIWLLYSKYQERMLKQTAFILIVGIILFLANIFYMPSTNISDSYFTLDGSFAVKRVLFWGIPSALLFFGVVLAEKKYTFKTPRWLVATGDASYSIYLVHLPFVKIFYQLWSNYPPLYSEALVIVTMILVCFCGYLFYRIIERPLLSWLNRLILPRLKQTH